MIQYIFIFLPLKSAAIWKEMNGLICLYAVIFCVVASEAVEVIETYQLLDRSECERAAGCEPSTCYNILSNPGCNPFDSSPIPNEVRGVICTSLPPNPLPTPPQGFRCADDTIILSDQFCDGVADCPDQSDEIEGMRGFRCRGRAGNASCLLPQRNLYDNVAHCADGSDLCANKQTFTCFNEPAIIISRNQVCDGEENCWDSSDEYTRDEFIRGFRCPQDGNDPFFICSDRKKIINIFQVCDGRFDCFDRSDECDYEAQLSQLGNFQLRCVQIDQCRSIFSSESDMIANVWLRVTLWLVAFIVIIGNTCVISFTSRSLKNSKASNSTKCQQLIILNIAVADIMMGIYLLCISANNVAFMGAYNFEIDRYWRYGLLCHIAGMLSAISSETSCFLMVLLTAYRFHTLTRPFSSTAAATTFRWKGAIATAWTISFILAFVPVIWFYIITGAVTNERVDEFDRFLEGLSRSEALDRVENIPFYYSATSVCLPRFYSDTTSRVWPYTFAVITINFLCFAFIGGAYIFIYRKTSSRLIRSERTDQLNTRMQRRIARIILTDCACWFPVCLMSYLALAGVALSDFAYVITAGLLLPINSALNPFLFSSLPDKIYEKVSKMVRRRKRGTEPVEMTNISDRTRTTNEADKTSD